MALSKKAKAEALEAYRTNLHLAAQAELLRQLRPALIALKSKLGDSIADTPSSNAFCHALKRSDHSLMFVALELLLGDTDANHEGNTG